MGMYEELVFLADAIRGGLHDIEFVYTIPDDWAGDLPVYTTDGDVLVETGNGIEIIDGRVRIYLQPQEG